MTKDLKWNSVKILPTDYQDYGGEIKRWQDTNISYPDCSSGCKWWVPLYDRMIDTWDNDWGVCINDKSPRSGLLTWEHQAGFKCFESKNNESESHSDTE